MKREEVVTDIVAGGVESSAVELCWMLDNGEDTGIVALIVIVRDSDEKVFEL